MTPARTRGKRGGNYQIDLRFKIVGRIKTSSGTDVMRVFNRRVGILHKLAEQGKYEILRALKDRKITIEQLDEADRVERLGSTVQDIQLEQNLWVQLHTVLSKMKPTVTNLRYAVSVRGFKQKGPLGDDAILSDLATVKWADLYPKWGGSNTDWMHMKRALSKLVGLALEDKYHPFVRKLRQAIPNKRPGKRRTALKPVDFLKIIGKAPEHAQVSYWCLLATGLRDRTEYLALRPHHLDHRTFTVNHPGEKTSEAAEPIKVSPRLWPIVVKAVPSRLQYGWLLKHWQRACVAAGYGEYREDRRYKSGKRYHGPTLHDLRRAHGQWAIDANIPASKVQSSFRHSNPGQTQDYLDYNTTGEVSEAIADVIEKATKAAKKRKRA